MSLFLALRQRDTDVKEYLRQYCEVQISVYCRRKGEKTNSIILARLLARGEVSMGVGCKELSICTMSGTS
jgi:hypothetical protein